MVQHIHIVCISENEHSHCPRMKSNIGRLWTVKEQLRMVFIRAHQHNTTTGFDVVVAIAFIMRAFNIELLASVCVFACACARVIGIVDVDGVIGLVRWLGSFILRVFRFYDKILGFTILERFRIFFNLFPFASRLRSPLKCFHHVLCIDCVSSDRTYLILQPWANFDTNVTRACCTSSVCSKRCSWLFSEISSWIYHGAHLNFKWCVLLTCGWRLEVVGVVVFNIQPLSNIENPE